jgi:hypothetical protein
LPIFIAELRNHHNKWAIIVFDAVPVITYAFGYLVLRGPVLTGSMVLWLAGFGVSICIWFAVLSLGVHACETPMRQRKEPTAAVLPTVHSRTLTGPLPTLRDFAGLLAPY